METPEKIKLAGIINENYSKIRTHREKIVDYERYIQSSQSMINKHTQSLKEAQKKLCAILNKEAINGFEI